MLRRGGLVKIGSQRYSLLESYIYSVNKLIFLPCLVQKVREVKVTVLLALCVFNQWDLRKVYLLILIITCYLF